VAARHFKGCRIRRRNWEPFAISNVHNVASSIRFSGANCPAVPSNGACRAFFVSGRRIFRKSAAADALAAMECLDRTCGDSHIDLDADEGVRDRIHEVMDLDVIVEIDAGAAATRCCSG
jgi:hypothetical protein